MSKFVPTTNVTIIVCLSCLAGGLYFISQDDAALMILGALVMFIKSE